MPGTDNSLMYIPFPLLSEVALINCVQGFVCVYLRRTQEIHDMCMTFQGNWDALSFP